MQSRIDTRSEYAIIDPKMSLIRTYSHSGNEDENCFKVLHTLTRTGFLRATVSNGSPVYHIQCKKEIKLSHL